MTSFYANYRRHPVLQNLQRKEVMNPASHTYAHWIASARDREKKALEAAWEKMSKYSNTRRTPPPAYNVGDAVMLSTAHLKLGRPSLKLDHKFIRPFQIQQFISPTEVRLTHPHQWNTHTTFQIIEVELLVHGNCPINFEKTLCECADI